MSTDPHNPGNNPDPSNSDPHQQPYGLPSSGAGWSGQPSSGAGGFEQPSSGAGAPGAPYQSEAPYQPDAPYQPGAGYPAGSQDPGQAYQPGSPYQAGQPYQPGQPYPPGPQDVPGGYGAPAGGYPPAMAYPPPGGYGPGAPAVDAWGRPLSDKSKVVAGILQLVPGFGIGRFYTGDTSTAVWQLVVTLITCGLGHIWCLVDGILILVNGGVDGQGRVLRD